MQRVLQAALLIIASSIPAVSVRADEAQLAALREMVQAKQSDYDRLSQLAKSNATTPQDVRKAQGELLEAKLQVAIASDDVASAKTLRAAQCINAKRQLEGVRRLLEQNTATETDLYRAEITLSALEVKYYTTMGMTGEAKASLQAAIHSSEKELANTRILSAKGLVPPDTVTTLEQQIAALKLQLLAFKN